MFINVSELQSLSSLDSLVFDREGYLFVKQRNDRLFNQWKSESFVERFVRLKGNILLIIATKTINDSIDTNCLSNTPNDRCLHILVLEEFAIKLIDESDKYYEFVIELNRNELIRSFHFATISHSERDEWIQSIHLSSFAFLRSLHKTLLNELNNSEKRHLDESIDTNYDLINCQRFDSLLLSISCNRILLNNSHKFDPKLVVYVYYKTIKKFWQFLGKTEISSSRNPRFDKCLNFPKTIHRLASIELQFKVYNVIETITNTKCLLGYSYFTFQTLSDNKTNTIHRLDLKSSINKKSIGVLAIKLSHPTVNCKQSLRKVLSFDSIVEYKQKYNISNESTTLLNKSIRTNSLPNILNFNCFENMSNFNEIMNSNLFTNTICKSFQFSIPKQKKIAFIDEYMSESQLCFTFPQTLMNIFMNDEKKLMNCITYSIGEVKTEFQRNQMRALECHLRLVNVLTESLNEISLYSAQKNFRPSTAKNDLYLQFIPVNFHLQRCLVSDADTNRNTTHDIFTVGAYCSHYLGFESGGMKNELFDSQNNSNNIYLYKTWNAMKHFFKISSLRDRIYFYLKELIDCVDSQTVAIDLMFDYFNKVDDLCKEIVSILSSKHVDESLAFCEAVRGNDSNNSSSVNSNTISASFERTVSLEETRKSCLFDNKEIKRHRSLPNDEQQELEPIDLIHLNIKASLISINSKLMNKNNSLSRNDLDASERKLKNAVHSLYRTSSICYASSALKLDRQQIELFYQLRLRRDMIVTQALTSLIIATFSKLNSVSFIRRAIETRSILSEHEVLLSCYADELGMLEDMAYALNQINSCVKFIFEASDQQNLQPRIEGNSFHLKVIFSVHNFPSSLKAIECSLSSVIFNVGINEYATLAETFGSVKLQESINKESYSRLEAYVNRIFVDNPLVATNMSALKSEIWSNRAKNVRILHLAQQIVQNIEGLRLTCCKSAKDRTSMAVTLEEARLCGQLFNINEMNEMQWFQNIVDTLRTEGTRRENTRKNVGIAKYAFNSLQLLTFPKQFRAPHGTYSSIET